MEILHSFLAKDAKECSFWIFEGKTICGMLWSNTSGEITKQKECILLFDRSEWNYNQKWNKRLRFYVESQMKFIRKISVPYYYIFLYILYIYFIFFYLLYFFWRRLLHYPMLYLPSPFGRLLMQSTAFLLPFTWPWLPILVCSHCWFVRRILFMDIWGSRFWICFMLKEIFSRIHAIPDSS